jgi:hypothetical protein
MNSLSELANQAQQVIQEITQHPEYQQLEYSPDVTIGDAQQAILELQWGLEEGSKKRCHDCES